MTTRLVLPYPPSINAAWKPWRNRLVKTTKAKNFAKQVAAMAKQQGAERLDGRLHVCVTLYRPRRIGDWDGPIKCLMDALNGIAWEDDKQIKAAMVFVEDDKVNPRTEIYWCKEGE